MLKDNDFDILNGSNIKWETDAHYRGMLTFAMSVAEFLGNIGDMKFINTLPMSMEEFHQQSKLIKDRYVAMLKSQYAHFADKNDEVITGVGAEKLDKYHQESLDSIKRNNPEEIKTLLSELMMGVRESESPPPAQTADGEYLSAVNLIKSLKKQNKALKLHRHKPTQMEMRNIIDDNRFKNDKCNNTKVGEALNIDPDTAKAWIEQLGLSDYAWNPENLK